MAYLASIHRPSSVRHAVKARFLSEDVDSLVVAKANRLEIYEQTPDGLAMSYSRAVNGKITILQKLAASDNKLEHLFIGTDRHMYFAVSWDSELKQLKTEKTYVDQADKTGRDAQSAEQSLVDPAERFMVLQLFEGILTVLPLTYKEARRKAAPTIRGLGEPIPVRVEELFIRSSAFLYLKNEGDAPKLALVYHDNQDKVYLQVKTLNHTFGKKGEAGDVDFENDWEAPQELDLSASHVIPVPGPASGMIIIAEMSISYHGHKNPKNPIQHSLQAATIFTAWERVDDTRWLLADDYGKIYFLMILMRGTTVQGFQIDCLGNASRASVLSYLGGGYAYIGSHSGDSQLIQIKPEGLEVMQTLPNIAPILDFTVMDMGSRAGEISTSEYSSGQARIVTGSGAFQDGSLRSVRSGVGLEDLGSLGEIGQITNLFPLRWKSRSVNTLVASLIDETRAFCFASDGEVEELQDFPGFSLNEQTLLAVNISEERLFQCTKSAARIIDSENGMVVADWACPPDMVIVSASASSEGAVLSIDGTELVVLELTDLKLIAMKNFDERNQVSCINVPQIQPQVCIIGFWHSAEVAILKLENLKIIRKVQIGDGGDNAVPRSILLTQILPHAPPTLFIAMADGHVVTFDVQTSGWELTSKKTTILGTQHANMQILPRGDGLYNVFATCEHPSLIHGSEDRVVYSAVTADKATCVCPFDSEAYPGAIAIATPEDLKIALVDEERTTHVQTLPIHETVRRIAYSTNLKAFGLGTIQRTLQDGEEVVKSHFKVADEVVFKELDTFELNEDEIVESVIRADLMDGPTDPVERFIVGTAYIDHIEPEAVRGRILIFEVTEDRKLKLLIDHKVKGACRALAVMDNMIVAALVKTVVVYAYRSTELERLAAYRTSTAPIDIAIVDNTIAIADLMKSISIVKYTPGAAGEPARLLEIARHYQIAWSTALAAIDDNTYLEADAEGNLIVLRQNINGVTADDRRRLEVTSEIQLGEMVNRIRRINVTSSEDTPVVPRAFMATVDGSVYLFALIRDDKQDFLMRLQDNIAAFVQSPGGIPFAKYRGFRNAVRETDGPYRFVDGDLVERFLDAAPELQEKMVAGLGASVEDTRLMVEALRRLH